MVTLHFVPHHEIASLTSVGRIRKLLSIAKENKIVLLEGRLAKEEEAELIKATMEEINKDFKGIELAVIKPSAGQLRGFERIKTEVVSFFLGDNAGLTIIGPASVVKSIRRDPHKIELLTREAAKK